MGVEAGSRVTARTATGELIERRAVTSVVRGADFPVIWVCSESGWAKSNIEGREPDGAVACGGRRASRGYGLAEFCTSLSTS